MTVSSKTGGIAGRNTDCCLVEAHLKQYETYKHTIKADDSQKRDCMTLKFEHSDTSAIEDQEPTRDGLKEVIC